MTDKPEPIFPPLIPYVLDVGDPEYNLVVWFKSDEEAELLLNKALSQDPPITFTAKRLES